MFRRNLMFVEMNYAGFVPSRTGRYIKYGLHFYKHFI